MYSKLLGQIPYSIVSSSQKRFLLKFTIPNVIYSLLCYGFYCATLYLFIKDRRIYSNKFPEISLIGNYNLFYSRFFSVRD